MSNSQEHPRTYVDFDELGFDRNRVDRTENVTVATRCVSGIVFLLSLAAGYFIWTDPSAFTSERGAIGITTLLPIALFSAYVTFQRISNEVWGSYPKV